MRHIFRWILLNIKVYLLHVTYNSHQVVSIYTVSYENITVIALIDNIYLLASPVSYSNVLYTAHITVNTSQAAALYNDNDMCQVYIL